MTRQAAHEAVLLPCSAAGGAMARRRFECHGAAALSVPLPCSECHGATALALRTWYGAALRLFISHAVKPREIQALRPDVPQMSLDSTPFQNVRGIVDHGKIIAHRLGKPC